LNKELQEVLRPKFETSFYDVEPIDIEFGDYEPVEIEYRERIYRLGDKVIQTCNNYDKEVFNGDTGIIKGIARDISSLTIDFGKSEYTKPVGYTKGELSEVQLAYAIAKAANNQSLSSS
jgi:ATP-dependent exoDNAse (exonuclease V) alpha subunit